MKKYLLLCLIGFALLPSCKKQEPVYGLVDQDIMPVAYGKKKLKSDQQFIAVLYATLFDKAISPSDMIKAEHVVRSIGDKRLAYELIISNYMNEPDIKLPASATMRADIPAFVEETYEKFYVRKPLAAEKEWMVNFIETHSSLTPELVYIAFATSDEYFFY